MSPMIRVQMFSKVYVTSLCIVSVFTNPLVIIINSKTGNEEVGMHSMTEVSHECGLCTHHL